MAAVIDVRTQMATERRGRLVKPAWTMKAWANLNCLGDGTGTTRT